MVPIDDLSDYDKELIDTCNLLLHQFNIPIKVINVEDIGATVFVTLYEGLYGEQLPGIVRKPVTREDEIHNCQTVIDSLSKDVLHISLSHIRAVEIINHAREDIAHLVEIFQGLSEYILTRIETDASDYGEIESVSESFNTRDDPDLVTPRVIDDILNDELQKKYDRSEEKRRSMSPTTRSKTEYINNYLQNTIERSPGLDSTGELIREGEKWEAKLQQNNKGTRSPNEFDQIGRRSPANKNGKTQKSQISPKSKQNGKSSPPLTEQILKSPVQKEKYSRTRPSDPSNKFETIRDSDRTVRQDAGRTRISDRGTYKTKPKVSEHLPASKYLDPGRSGVVGVPQSRVGLYQNDEMKSSNSDIHHTFTHHLYHHYTNQDLSNVPHQTVGSSVGPCLSGRYLDLDHHPSRLNRSSSQPTASKPQTGILRKIPKNNDSSMSASLPVKLNPQPAPHGRFRATVGITDYRQQPNNDSSLLNSHFRENDDSDIHLRGLATSYDNLQNLVQSTATLARTAVGTSPIRMEDYRDPSYLLTPPRYRSYPRPRSAVLDDRDIVRDINKTGTSRYQGTVNISSNSSTQSPDQMRRKVSFQEDRSSDSGSDKYEQPLTGAPNVSLEMKRKQGKVSRQPTSSKQKSVQPTTKYGSYIDDSTEIDSESDCDKFAEHRFDDLIEEALSIESEPVRLKTKKHQPSANKQVRFEKILNKTGKTALAATRKNINKESKKGDKVTQYIRKVYAEDYDDYCDQAENDLKQTKEIVIETENQYRKRVGNKTGRKSSTSSKPRAKSGLGVNKVPLTKPVSTKVRKCSTSSSGILPRKTMLTVHDEDELLPVLLDEFPYLHMSENTWHELMRQGLTQIENITKAYRDTKRKKSKGQTQIEEAVKRHETLTKLVKKQMDSMKRVREAKEQKKQQIQFKNKIHEKRQQSARARKYYNEYSVRARSKLLRRRTKEEMIFKKLFQDGLSIQKERIQDIRQYAREQRNRQAKLRQDELDSMENYYRDQFEMLASKVTSEREDLLIREKAQQKALDQLKKELRKKMEKEIQGYQDQLFRDDDDAYFRQLDADRLRQELHLAKYQTKI